MTSLNRDIAALAARPEIRALDVGAFGRDDLFNLILQRSEVLYDVPRAGQLIRLWEGGDPGPLEAEVDRLGPEIARRAAGVIWEEFTALLPVLSERPVIRLADIGCGYAIFDLFAARALGCDPVLIDLEANARRHFSFAAEGAAYSSLSVARGFLESNGIAPKRISTLNPGRESVTGIGPVDLVVSFLSCGFHYPVSTYTAFFARNVAPGGRIMLDLRLRGGERGARAEDQIGDLAPLGSIRDLPAPPKARRVLVTRPGGVQ